MISRHRSPIRLFAFTVKRRPFMRAAAQPLHVQRFIASVKQRILTNRIYQVTAQSDKGISAIKKVQNILVDFNVVLFRGKNFAVLSVKWDKKDPSLIDLDSIREAFFGDIYTMVNLLFTGENYEARIFHCIDDKYFPEGNGS